MANFPNSIWTPSNPAATDQLSSGHAAQHTNVNNEVAAIEAELGTNPKGSAASVKARFDGETWVAPTLLNSWVNYGGSTYEPAGYYKDGLGQVHIRGMVKNGTNPAVVFTLPTGYRPEYVVVAPSPSGNGNALGTSRIEVRQNGDVYIISTSGTTAFSLIIPSFRAYA